ncbi:M1 family peptidase [Halomonas campisalis]|uniref:M1 family peptidase n=1 Tax=Billgrantia campisalis TaxID=74661 RepID=A0ABS9P4D2_9GAMM|nr:M1 family aminopeptidase [Halomonas campisalis]MCG6656604.1 M1 family peptidase [Halomonas campisalis]MDR5861791.1 M1 family aminopeptidase [Halomonas campisalis]
MRVPALCRRGRCRLAAGLLAVPLLLPTVAAAGEEAAEPPRVAMSVSLDPSRGHLEGEMTLAAPPATARLGLLPGLALEAATAEGAELAVQRDGEGRYRLAVPEGAETLTLRWRGGLDGGESRVTVAPAGTLLPAGSGWYPRFADLEAFALDLEIRVPEGQRAVGTGSLVGEPHDDEGGYRVRHAHPRTDGVELAAGPWRERQRTAEGVRLRTLFPAELDAAFADTYLEHSARYLALFSERVGPYPYASFTIAASPAPVGLAFPGFTLLGERVIPLPFIPRTSLAHELMHAWWGAGVRVDYATGNWSEALTTYLADYHLDERRGEARDTRRRWLTDLAALPDGREMRLADFRGGPDPAGRLVGYQHGAMVFHMLRGRIGDEAFDAGLHTFAERHLFHTADWDDLAAAFETAAGEPLGDFFDAWVRRPGRPSLALTEVERQRTEEGWKVRGRLEQSGTGAPWPLRVPLAVESEAGVSRQVVELEGRHAEVSLTLAEAPRALVVDPDFEVLRELEAAPFTLRRLALDPDSRLLALDADLAPLGQRLPGRPRPLEAVPARLEETPLLVVGETEAVAAWLADQGLPAPPRDMARRGQARLWTLPGTRTAAMSGDNREALEQLAGTLRHHQHRSYLVLDARGETEEAGTWPPGDDGLRVELVP